MRLIDSKNCDGEREGGKVPVASNEVKEHKLGSVLNIDLHEECREQILRELRVVQRQMTIAYKPRRI